MTTWGYAINVAARLILGLSFAAVALAVYATGGSYTYSDGHELYSYSLNVTGENHTFEFQKSPGKQDDRLKAAVHVLQTVYEDGSINPRHSSFFTKEGAKCFVFDATFHTYTSCFLPNEYSPGNAERFWGYVTRVPNVVWLLTYNLLPALLVLGGFAYWMLRENPATAEPLADNVDRPVLRN